MGQSSGPLTNSLFTDDQWRTLIGAEPGVVGDTTGMAYALTLPSSSNSVQVGSATQRSAAAVAGFAHSIPAGEAEPVTIPESVGGSVVHVIALRYDPAWAASAPGPVRLVVISGAAGGAAPALDGSYPGVEDMPLWRLTRAPGQALSQVTPVDLRVHTGPMLHVLTEAALPLDVPIGTVAWVGRGGRDVRARVVVSPTTGAVDWVRMFPEITHLESVLPTAGIPVPAGVETVLAGWQSPASWGGNFASVSGDAFTITRDGVYAVHLMVSTSAQMGANPWLQLRTYSGVVLARAVPAWTAIGSVSLVARIEAGTPLVATMLQSSGGTVAANAHMRVTCLQGE